MAQLMIRNAYQPMAEIGYFCFERRNSRIIGHSNVLGQYVCRQHLWPYLAGAACALVAFLLLFLGFLSCAARYVTLLPGASCWAICGS